ncbi:unnamed protein product [Penicillium salamii]|uniref:Branched-chain-amino-acid aminotransferase n=1 Tax=Penicillium salamii TaxID=1612424 RepID=A0A9W4N140_9EURO|nr:unnamed protein product [Penicillium salamii]CAG8251503.1 unnamed protein product [Penicillium salamii]CAG8266519.1 unnamed protein product [Penicillium salamii]CAG8341112.1 unnamed protein product [Penicillium salamii]CAG8376967.1 unnamed protein product [Penicillium salamii]
MLNMANEQPLDASKLSCTYTTSPREVPSEATLRKSGQTICTDHMITASWTAGAGWSAPELKPFGPLSLLPSASCLHYAYECFEGLKAYRGDDGKLRMFRTDRNSRRFLMSAGRISLPQFEPDELEKLIHKMVSVDGSKWLPKERAGQFLYVRPTMIGTDSQLGVTAPQEALLYIILGFTPQVDTPLGGKRLLTSPNDMVRSWVGGFGFAKVGANYGPSVLANQEAIRQGYHQILWLYGPEGFCTEAGGSNFFVLWNRKEDGKRELITAPLDDQLILDGVTRRSCIELVRERLDLEVTERRFTIDDLQEAAAENRLIESFATGTAWFITPISQIHHRGQDINIPTGPDGGPAEITGKIKAWLGDMMYGRAQHGWITVIPEESLE